MRFYRLLEFNGKGWGYDIECSNDKNKLLSMRENILSNIEAKLLYGPNYFYTTDVRCTVIQTYKSESQYNKNKDAVMIETWY